MNRAVATTLKRTCRTALILGLLAWTAGARAHADEAAYLYGVWYGDKRIGEHEFLISRSPEDGLHVRSEATMEFRVLFVPVYRYRHVAEEIWQDGCLTDLSAETNDNGTRYALRALARSGTLTLEQDAPAPQATEVAALDCPASFAYWNRELLHQEQLLNPQTGVLSPVSLIAEGTELIDGAPARRYRLSAEGLSPIWLWYRATDDLWLRLETERDGHTISYRLEHERPSAQLAAIAGAG